MYKEFKNITLLFTLILSFFIGINTFKAYDTKDDAITCTYKGTVIDENNLNVASEVVVHIKKTGEIKAIYTHWRGANVTNEKDVSNYKMTDEKKWNVTSRTWASWIYENNKGKTSTSATCPEYLLVGTTRESSGYCNTHFMSGTNDLDYADNCKNYQMSLKNVGSSRIADLQNPYDKNFNSLYFKSVTKSSGPYFDEVNSKGTTNSIEVAGNGEYLMYVKTANDKILKGHYMNPNKLECNSENNGIAEVIEKTFDSKYPNNTYAVIRIKTGMASNTKINCTYTKDNGTKISASLTVKVSGSSNTGTTTYTNPNLTCESSLTYNNNSSTINLGKIKTEVIDYNDGNNPNAPVKYYYQTQYGGWQEIDNNKDFTVYGTGGTSYTVKFNVNKSDYLKAVLKTGVKGSCPELYVDKAALSSKYTISTTRSGTIAETDDGFVLEGNGCRINVGEGDNNIGAITFLRYKKGNEYKYTYIKNNDKDNETIIGSAPNEIAKTYYDTKVVYTSAISYYIQFSKEAVKAIYDEYGVSCPPQNKKVCSKSDFDSANTGGVSYIYSFSTDQSVCGSYSGSESSGSEGSGRSSSSENNRSSGSNPESTSELIVVDPGNGEYGKDFCDVIFVGSVKDIVKMLILGIRIAVPVMLILLSMIEFMKAVSDADKMPTAKKNTITRLIIGVIVFLLPSFIKLIFTLADLDSCADIF